MTEKPESREAAGVPMTAEFAQKKRRAIFDGLNDVFTEDQWIVIERGMAYFGELWAAQVERERDALRSRVEQLEQALGEAIDNFPPCKWTERAERLVRKERGSAEAMSKRHNLFWSIFFIANGVEILVFAAVLVWAFFDVHNRIPYVMFAQIPPLVMMGLYWLARIYETNGS